MPVYPLVPAAYPVPVAADPYIAGLRGRRNDIDLRRRRCHHHDAIDGVFLIRRHRTSG